MTVKQLALFEVATPQVTKPQTAKKKPHATRVANAAIAYVGLLHKRQQTCGGYCAMTVGMCRACRDEATALYDLEQVIRDG